MNNLNTIFEKIMWGMKRRYGWKKLADNYYFDDDDDVDTGK